MTVNITMASLSGDSQLEEVVDLGSLSPGEESSEVDIYIRHDAENNSITDCSLYVTRYTGSDYSGANGADDDYSEVLSWGDTSGSGSHSGGGLYLNQNHSSSFPTVDWHPFRSGYGSDPNNSIELLQAAINNTGTGWTPADGEIPVNGEAHIKCRWDVPLAASSAGIRFIYLIMAYSYTS
jgi:hypothetical protein